MSNPKINFYKVSGAGNHFILIDARTPEFSHLYEQNFGNLSRAKLAQKLCNPYKSIGADGLLFLESSSSADLRWDFYNSDGSSAEMCGNAARCVGEYQAFHAKDKSLNFELETAAGIIEVIVQKSGDIEVTMPKVKTFKAKIKTKDKITFDFVNTGVPHAVIETNLLKSLNVSQINVNKLAVIVDKVRKLSQFKTHGTNVTFYFPIKENNIKSLTFERGVEGYTQACGTGAVAAVVGFLNKNSGIGVNKKSTVAVQVPGGELIVTLSKGAPKLRGPAHVIYSGEIL